MAAVPAKLVEDTALVGPVAKIRDDLERWKESVVTTLLLSGDATTLRTRCRALRQALGQEASGRLQLI